MHLNIYLILKALALYYDTCEDCWSINEKDMKHFANRVQNTEIAMVPGTKWCGPGNIASNYEDLGTERQTDMCCRAHDICPGLIETGETKHNLTNDSYFTRMSCECDDMFRRCLRSVNNRKSNQIGSVYFNMLPTKCYRKDYPVTKCLKHGGWLRKKCFSYTYDTTQKKIYQWFDIDEY